MAETMLKVAKDIKNKVSDEAHQKIISTFWTSDITQELKDDLIEISNYEKTISNKEAEGAILYFSRFYDIDHHPYTLYNKEALWCLNSKEMAKVMLKVVMDVENVSNQKDKNEITAFLFSEIRKEFEKHLHRDSMNDDETISESKVIDALLFFAGFYGSVDHPHYFLDKGIEKHLYSWEMAKVMLKVANDTKKDVLEQYDEEYNEEYTKESDEEYNEESNEDMITNFLYSHIGKEFKEDLTRITKKGNKTISNYEFLERLKP
ncbi:hypothetical protein IWQ61_010448, partial [Dispira simplex]